MLKQLRIKFVIINMTLVTLMLLVIFGIIVHQTQENLKQQSIQVMQRIGTEPGHPDRPGGRPADIQLPYLQVFLNNENEVIAVKGHLFDLSDEDQTQNIIRAALRSSAFGGDLPEYNVRFCRFNPHNGETLVFVDITGEQATIADLIRTCILIGIASFGVFLVISFLLARWAVKPVDAAWRQQKQFVADASHELKTPLAVIMTNAELLQHPEYDAPARERFSASILTMSRQMRDLLEGLLELARVDNGAVQNARAPLSFSALTEEACLVFEPLFYEKGLFLDSRVAPNLELRGSEIHLQQVLKILLDNAMKYSDPGTVSVTLQKQGSGCLLTVANPGSPISPEDRKNIFKRFYRVDKSRRRDGSYGLGLSIAENIVLEHRGRIWVESIDGQNRFHVFLPAN